MNIFTGRYSGRSRLALIAGIAGAAMLNFAAVQAQPGSSGVNPAEPAVWQAYELNFHYFGFTTYYSCSGLENRLEQILQEMGANKDVRVSASGCFGPSNIGNMLSARIRVRMPMTSSEPQPQSFPAVSKSVTLKSGGFGDIGSGDCELLEQVRDQILPALKLQLVKDDLGCIPGHANYAGRSLQVKALMPATAAK